MSTTKAALTAFLLKMSSPNAQWVPQLVPVAKAPVSSLSENIVNVHFVLQKMFQKLVKFQMILGDV